MITLHIDSIAYLGSGVARHEGKVIFVPLTCVGETVEAEIVEEHESFSRARLIRVVKPSPDRESKVLYSPGCCYGHMSHDAELLAKKEQLEHFIKHPVREIISSMRDTYYRNKITLEAGPRGELGYLGEDNQTVIDMPQDPLAHPAINARLAALRADPLFRSTRIPRRKTVLRYTPRDGVVVWQNMPPEQTLTEVTEIGTMQVQAGGFFQINPSVLDLLMTTVAESLTAHDLLIDLYCGVGVLALAACRRNQYRVVMGYEYDSAAVADARMNAANMGITNAHFRQADIEKKASQIITGQTRNASVIVDPPRRGLPESLITALCANPPAQLCYVSCSPDTLGRDLQALLSRGFKIERTVLVDMFPRTAHFESVVVMSHA